MNLQIKWTASAETTHEVATMIRAARPIPNLPDGLTDHQLLEHATAEALIRLLVEVHPKLVEENPDLVRASCSPAHETGYKSSRRSAITT